MLRNRDIGFIEGLKAGPAYYFGSFERVIGIISVFLGLVSVLGVIYQFVVEAELPKTVEALTYTFIVLTLVAIIGFLLVRYVNRDRTARIAQKYLSEQFAEAHSIVEKYRNTHFAHYLELTDGNLDYEASPRDLDLFKDVCRGAIHSLKSSFVKFFKSKGIDIGDDISLSVKLIMNAPNLTFALENVIEADVPDEGLWVVTFWRDHDTYMAGEREVGVAIYSIDGNTAFRNIYRDGQPHFMCDDLASLNASTRGTVYSNENDEYQKFYNSVLVVPIRYQEGNAGNQFCFGFLAVDSKNEQQLKLFAHEECVHIIKHVANLLAMFFLTLALFRHYEKLEIPDDPVEW